VLLGDVRTQSSTSLYTATPHEGDGRKREEELAGVDAINNYIDRVKEFKKIKEKQNLEGAQPTYPLVEYLTATDRRQIMPKTIGLIKRKPTLGASPSASYKTIYIGKDYAEPFSEGIKMINTCKALDLSSSDLSYNTMEPILKKAPISLEDLKIPQNHNLTPKIYKSLGNMLDDRSRK
jgi:hypothetical protein